MPIGARSGFHWRQWGQWLASINVHGSIAPSEPRPVSKQNATGIDAIKLMYGVESCIVLAIMTNKRIIFMKRVAATEVAGVRMRAHA
jgi:hypothetical protein